VGHLQAKLRVLSLKMTHVCRNMLI